MATDRASTLSTEDSRKLALTTTFELTRTMLNARLKEYGFIFPSNPRMFTEACENLRRSEFNTAVRLSPSELSDIYLQLENVFAPHIRSQP